MKRLEAEKEALLVEVQEMRRKNRLAELYQKQVMVLHTEDPTCTNQKRSTASSPVQMKLCGLYACAAAAAAAGT